MHFPIRIKFATILAILFLLSVSAYATAPGMISYQGRLTDGAGLPLTGNYSLTFNIYSLAVGGLPLWSETQNPVVVDEGIFTVLLGTVNPINTGIFLEANRYIGVQVNGGVELTPRKQIVAVAFALQVATIDGASGGYVEGNSRIEGSVVIGTGDADGTLSFAAGANNAATGNYSIALGADNSASGHYSNVSGGLENVASGAGAGIGGGSGNLASGDSSFVGSGSRNTASGSRSVIGGGRENLATGDYSYIGGGWLNYTESLYSTVGGGERDTASGQWSTVAGGRNNDAEGGYSTIGGGTGNRAVGTRSFIGGGVNNFADGFDAIVVGGEYCSTLVSGGFVGGGDQNSVTGGNAVVVGGFANKNSGLHSFVGGGAGNSVSGDSSVIGGGYANNIAGFVAVIGGGRQNQVTALYGAISGGLSNQVNGLPGGFIGGGIRNIVEGNTATVAGGYVNEALNARAFVGGGQANICEGAYSSIVGGLSNFTDSLALYSSICGGNDNSAFEDYSAVISGFQNNNEGLHSTILGGSFNSIEDELLNPAQYIAVFGQNVRAGGADYRMFLFDGTNSGRLALNHDLDDGGALYPIHVGTANTNGNGARLTAAGVWTDASSRSFKENFVEIGGSELLDKISQLSLPHYNYKGTTEKHIGPMAEDFAALFNVGSVDENTGQIDPMYLSAKDVAGVSLAGVKELIAENKKLESRIAELERIVQSMLNNRK